MITIHCHSAADIDRFLRQHYANSELPTIIYDAGHRFRMAGYWKGRRFVYRVPIKVVLKSLGTRP